MTSDFLLWISHGWVVTFQNSHCTVFTFRGWLDLLDVALAVWISILKISKLLQNCWYRVIDITSFEKHLESSFKLDHTRYSEILSKFGDILFQEYLSKGISHPIFYGDLVYKLRRIKDTPNFISSGSKIVKRLVEKTIGLVLGPSTALYRPFLKHCTLTNKAVGTIWRVLSKPPQRRHGPDPLPLWLFVGTPSVIRPEFVSRRAEHIMPYSVVAIYIYLIYNTGINYLCCLCIDFYDLSAWCGCWFIVYIRRFTGICI